jgi:hypothetical protein
MIWQSAQHAAFRVAAALALCIVAITACAPQESAAPVIFATLPPLGTAVLGTSSASQVSPDTSLTPTPETTAPIIPTAPLGDQGSLTDAAISALADELGISASEVAFVSIVPAEWSDLSLGCPQPGHSYPQVVTPGFVVALSVNGVGYEVHTDAVGTAVVCIADDGGSSADPIVQEFIDAAKQDLSQMLVIPPDQIAVVRSEAVDWTDSSLGCAAEGRSYDQVITSGYRIILAVEETRYEYHTDSQRIFLCESPSQ